MEYSGIAFIVINIIMWFVIDKFIYNRALKHPKRIWLYFLIFFFIFPLSSIVAIFTVNNKWLKLRKNTYDALINNPSDKEVDNFIVFINKYGCEDRPNAWHQLRGVWYAVNESTNVSTAKKQQLRTFLMTKGLYLNNDEKKIIDNYAK